MNRKEKALKIHKLVLKERRRANKYKDEKNGTMFLTANAFVCGLLIALQALDYDVDENDKLIKLEGVPKWASGKDQ